MFHMTMDMICPGHDSLKISKLESQSSCKLTKMPRGCIGVASAPTVDLERAGAAKALAPKLVLETVLRKTHRICVTSGGDATSATLSVAVENMETGDKFSKVPQVLASAHSLSSNSQSCFVNGMMVRR